MGNESAEVVLPRPFAMQPQGTPNWCWVAVASSIATYVGRPMSQCQLANYGLAADAATLPDGGAANDCCVDRTTRYCDRAAIVPTALGAFGAEGATILNPLLMPDIVGQLSPPLQVPIVAELQYGALFHVVVITAATPDDDEVYICDPEHDPGPCSLTALSDPAAPGGWQLFGKWKNTAEVAGGIAAAIVAPAIPPAGRIPRRRRLRDVPKRSALREATFDLQTDVLPVERAVEADDLSGAIGTGSRVYGQGDVPFAIDYSLDGEPRGITDGEETAQSYALLRALAADGPALRELRIPGLPVRAVWQTSPSGQRITATSRHRPFSGPPRTMPVGEFLEILRPIAKRRVETNRSTIVPPA